MPASIDTFTRPLLTWRKSSYSGMNNGDCVEVADAFACAVPVRDSKNASGPQLTVGRPQWARFVSALKHGELSA